MARRQPGASLSLEEFPVPHIRMPYWSLPPGVRDDIEREIGPVATATSVGTGLNSSVAALANGHFIKALPADHRWAWTQQREAEVAPYVAHLAPALIARVVRQGWDVLIFEALDGAPADYGPGSVDLPAVSQLLIELGDTLCPEIELREASLRLRAYAEDSDLPYFTGPALLHTDLNNANVIVNGGRARLVDWGWATRGALWLDPAYWVIWLIAAGHEPAAAEHLAATIPSWCHASAVGIDAFVSASVRLWADIAGDDPDAFAKPVLEATRRWDRYRKGLRP
jgi:hypothetical protein